MLVRTPLARGALAFAAALLLATSTQAQFGLPGSEGGDSDLSSEAAPVYYGPLVTGDTVIHDPDNPSEYEPTFKYIDNLFFGGPDPDELRDHFEDHGWDSEYDEDSFKSGFLKELKYTDVVYIVSHAGVSESTGEVGLAWRNLFGLNKTVVLASDIREALADGYGPKLVVVVGCQSAANDTLARAFPNAAFVGFAEKASLPLASKFARGFLEKIAEGQSIQAAYDSTPVPGDTVGFRNGKPRLILPLDPNAD
jgi:hypothetical protein